MSLDKRESSRQRIHSRRISIEGFLRDDGLWDIEGHLVDIKDQDLTLAYGVRPAGRPLHDMWVRVTVDRSLTVIDAQAAVDSMPYPDLCNLITPAYRSLIGIKIGPGFRRRVKTLLGGVNGCSHLTEIVSAIGAGAVQTLAAHVSETVDARPFQLNGCHAWSSSGVLVREFYPRWHERRTASDRP